MTPTMVLTANKTIAEGILLNSGFLELQEGEKRDVLFKPSEEKENLKIQFVIENIAGADASVTTQPSAAGDFMQVILSNLPDGPGRIPEPLLIAKNAKGGELYIDLDSPGVTDGKRIVRYSVIEQKIPTE